MKMVSTVLLGMLLLTGLLAAPATEKSGEGAKVDRALVKGNDAFALDLYAQLRRREGNLFLSPNSISTALAMTYVGARGQTAEQMAGTLHFSLDRSQLDHAFAALLKELNGQGKKRGYQLSVANALWGQKGFGFLAEFLKETQENYGAGLHEVDFARDPESVRQTINAWVEKATKDKIKDLLQSGDLDTNTRLVLTNAIYFKGNWAARFKKDQTHDQPFHVTPDQQVQVPMMNQHGDFKYLAGSDSQALELPYEGKELSMVVFLPKKVDGLAELEQGLTADKLTEWLAKMRSEEVELALPKFQMTSQFHLAEVLSQMGMPLMFSQQADFSGMNGRQDLHVSGVIHKAFVDVNEEGTEAAAATGVVLKLAAAIGPVFRADHPFVFLIRDNRSGSILFMGRVTNPKK